MSITVTYTDQFEKEAKRLVKKYPSLQKDILELVTSLEKEPFQGTDLGKGLHKIRLAIASKGKGKRGGARVISYVAIRKDTVYLVSIYDKSELENVSSIILRKILKEEGIIDGRK